jgi:nitrate reductase (cytochrome), electron transfer subunit
MMKRLLALMLMLVATLALAQTAPAPVHREPFRGDSTFTDTTRPPRLVGAENKDVKRVRSYAMQPPTIPHAVDNYQIDRFANKCMMCHSRVGAGDSQATPISITHYTDRNGSFLADVDARRYFCDTCHVVQMDVDLRVRSRFEDVDTIVRRAQAERAKAQKK